MSRDQHVPADLLAAFVEGDVGEHVAAHIAEHIDGCPRCATQAAAMEPLAKAFASMDDPPVPDDLVDAVLAELHQTEPAPVVELAVGGGLLGSAGVLAIVTQHPVTLLADVGAVLGATEAIIRSMAAGLSPFTYLAATMAGLAAAGSVATMRFATAGEA